MDILKDLNPQQRQAVTAGLGQILVLAGPGSGKTRVLTHRIAYLIGSMGVRPHAILAVTFTNKAAREMEARLGRILGESIQGLWLGTFHAICARILRREEKYLPFKSNFVIFDSDDQETLIKRAIRDLRLDEKLYKPASIHAGISNAKNELLGPKDYPVRTYRDEVVARVYARYQELLLANNAVDFDDLLMVACNLMQDNPDVRERYARRFEHVLVDEFQDTNLAQYELLKHLCSDHQNIFVVGDEDQSIYRWRGADYRNVLRFEQDYPQSQKILLEQNYRSTQTVLDAARAVIDQNSNLTAKHLFSDRGAGEKIVIYEAGDETGEAAYVVDLVAQLVASQKANPGEIAVMYRTNAQSRLLEEAFLRAGLPYRLVGAQRFYGRREVKDLISYLRLVHNPADEVSLSRVINVPPRGIGDKTMVALQLTARQANISPGAVLLDLGRLGSDSAYWKTFGGRGAILLSDFGALLAGWRDLLDTNPPLPTLFDRILEDTGYKEYINDNSEEGQDRWANVEELRRLAFEYRDKGLSSFLETLALVSDQDTLAEGVDAPTLLTLHAAKGLEFGQVFITGLDEGLLPHSRSRDDPEEMAEERRLFYVGLTRAKNKLYLVRSERRSNFGSWEESIPSRFLDDIPAKLIQHSGIQSGRSRGDSSLGRGARRERYSRWESDSTYLAPSYGGQPSYGGSAPIIQQKYQPNMRVKHPVWGEGLVVDSRIQDNDETVDVFFETVGFKRLAASLAKLEIIG
ncbi:MAG TPA: UvrD-helicase domain-containing protein [Anaerolineaceae bacterium]